MMTTLADRLAHAPSLDALHALVQEVGMGPGWNKPMPSLWPTPRKTYNVYSVVRGRGETVVDGERFEWSRGDVVVAPAWRPHEHHAAEDTVLFRVTDAPLLDALGFLRSA